MKEYNLDRVVRILFSAAVVLGLIWLTGYLSDVLIPFAVALLLAYLLNPLVLLVQRKIRNRSAAVLLSLGAVAAVAVILGLLVIPLIMKEISHMGTIVSQTLGDATLAERAAKILPSGLWQRIQGYLATEEVQRFFKSRDFWQILVQGARKILPGAWGVVTGATSFLLGIVGLAVIILYLIFVLLDYERIRQGWRNLVPPAYRDSVAEFVSEFEMAMTRYFRGQALVSAIGAVLSCIGFVLIGLPMGILLGLLMGLLNMVPYLQALAIIPAFLLAIFKALETGSSPWMTLGLTALVLAVVQIIQDWFVAPKIMGKVTGLNPALMLLSLSVWGKLLGFLGLIIALPMTCLILAYYRRLLSSTQSGSSR